MKTFLLRIQLPNLMELEKDHHIKPKQLERKR